MRNDTLVEAVLDFYGFEKYITVNSLTGILRLQMFNALHLPYEVPVYWVFVKVKGNKYEFDHVERV